MEAPPPAAQTLTLLREAKGWTQRELAEASGVSQAVLSKAESGLADLGSRVPQVAAALGWPVEALVHGLPLPGAPVTCLHHRRRSSQVNVKAHKRVQALAHLTRVAVTGLADAAGATPSVDQLLTGRAALRGPVDAAAAVRRRFGLGDVPIEDATGLVEQLGAIVVVRPLGTAGQDAVSSWDGTGWPLVIVNTGLPGDRGRFTALHEAAHLLLHTVPDEGQEQEAHRFAAELLFPASVAGRELGGLSTRDFPRLVRLKETWGLSIAALIQRALDVGAVDQAGFTDLRIRLSRLGWHRLEPVKIPEEQPTRLPSLVTLARRRGLSDRDLAAAAAMTVPAFLSEAWASASIVSEADHG